MIKFQENKTYVTRSICDSNCIHSFKIIKRTAKTVKTKVYGEIVFRRIFIHNNVECFKPFGTYSMSATISADKIK